MRTDSRKLEKQKAKRQLRPVMRHNQNADDVWQQIRQDVLRQGAVSSGQAYWCGKLVMLFVEKRIEEFRME